MHETLKIDWQIHLKLKISKFAVICYIFRTVYFLNFSQTLIVHYQPEFEMNIGKQVPLGTEHYVA